MKLIFNKGVECFPSEKTDQCICANEKGIGFIFNCFVTLFSLRVSSRTSHPSQTWGVLTQSGSSWWWAVWCSSWGSLVALERCEKTLSCSNLYVCPSSIPIKTILPLEIICCYSSPCVCSEHWWYFCVAVLCVPGYHLLPGTDGRSSGFRVQRLDQGPAQLLHQQ